MNNGAPSERTEPRRKLFVHDHAEALFFSLPGTPWGAQRFRAEQSACPSPMCRCATIGIDVYPDDGEGDAGRAPRFSFDLALDEERLGDRALAPDTGAFAEAFVAALGGEDWGLLYQRLYADKMRQVAATPEEALEVPFSVEAIERDGTMAGFIDLLPWREPIALELGAHRFFVENHFCVMPGCECTETYADLYAMPEPGSDKTTITEWPTIRMDYRTGRGEIVESGGLDRKTLKQAIERLSEASYRERFRERHDTLRRLYRLHRKKHLPDLPTPAISSKVGRNDPCPCGSGKKYKRCCLGK